MGGVRVRSGLILLMASDEDPPVLKIEEAGRSALEPFVDRSQYKNTGQRVVTGQRLLQSANDTSSAGATSDLTSFLPSFTTNTRALHLD